ncbi:MAG: hypoxanthine phosphoribosyltransferase [Woeseiaceae bacterium]|nr:hypoxanthine phosphoribosyltransferase [Woeseiaceae bacterium]
MNKSYVAANDLLLDSFQLAVDIYDSGFRPDFLVGLWRGGSGVGIAVQEGLEFLGFKTDHIAIRTSYRGQDQYSAMIDKAESIRAHGLRYLHERVCEEHSMLIVDDVYSTGSSVNAVINSLAKKSRRNLPHDIRIATVWYRPTDKTIRAPDYFVHETADWLILPYELAGLSLEDLRDHKPEIQPVIDRLGALVEARRNKPAA